MLYFRAIYIEPPFAEWGFYKTVSIPVWRVAEPDTNVAIVADGKWLQRVMTCIERWGINYKDTYPTYNQKLCVYGVYGNPPEPDYSKPPFAALTELPGPRLAMNYNRKRTGWRSWHIFGWPDVDPFAYPIRANYVEVSYEVNSMIQEIRELYLANRLWRFRVGDLLNEIGERVGLDDAVTLARQATGVSTTSLENMAYVARKVAPDQRGATYSTYLRAFRIIQDQKVKYAKKIAGLGNGSDNSDDAENALPADASSPYVGSGSRTMPILP